MEASVAHPVEEGDSRRPSWGYRLAFALTRSWMILILLFAALMHGLLVGAMLEERWARWDFSHYYVSSLAMREGLNPYKIDLRKLGDSLHVEGIENATYPPTFLLCFEPLTLMAPRSAFWVWSGLNLAALAATLIILLGGSEGPGRNRALALVALVILYPPLSVHLYYAQPQLLILLLLVFVVRLLERGGERGAGLVLALASLLKIFPVLMAGYLIVRRRWLALGYLAAGIVAGLAVTVAVLGAARTFSFASAAQAITSTEFMMRPANLALSSFVSRLFAYAFSALAFPKGVVFSLLRYTAALLGGLALIVLTVRTTASGEGVPDDHGRAFSLWLVTTLMLSPTAWIHYCVLLIFPFIQVAVAAWEERADARAAWFAAGSYALIAAAMTVAPSLESHGFVRLLVVVDECAFVSVLLAYISAYHFAAWA